MTRGTFMAQNDTLMRQKLPCGDKYSKWLQMQTYW